MRFFLVFIIFLLSNSCFSQSDSVILKTPAIFSITFYEHKKVLLSSNQYTSYDEVYLDVIEQDFLSFRKKYPGDEHPGAISKFRRIALKDIKSLGYAKNTQETFGAVLGMGIGAVSGLIITAIGNGFDKADGKFNPGNNKSFTTPVLAWAGAGAILGYIIGGKSNKYETFDLGKYDADNEKKVQEIRKIVNEGLNYKEKNK